VTRETILHPVFFRATYLTRCAPHLIEKFHLRRFFSLYVRMNLQKETDDHVVYFKFVNYIC
jgi:hypothetical protein